MLIDSGVMCISNVYFEVNERKCDLRIFYYVKLVVIYKGNLKLFLYMVEFRGNVIYEFFLKKDVVI